MRLNAAPTAAKSSPALTEVTASARATASLHIVRVRGKHRLHHVIRLAPASRR